MEFNEEYKYKFSCNYTEKELIDGYMDRKASIRYKRALLGTIAVPLMAIVFSKSSYYKHFAWYQSYIFWIICALMFMVVFAGNNHKIMWNSMSQRTYSAQTSNYDIYLCEDCVNIIYTLSGIRKVFKYDELNMYEVNNYILLENEYLNGYYISKEKVGEYQIENVKSFLNSKSKIKNLQLPAALNKFARMPLIAEIIIIALLIVPIIFNMQTNTAKQAVIGERVICNNLGITVKEASHVEYGKSNPIELYKVDLLLENFQKDTAGSKEYSQVDFKLIGKDENKYGFFSITDPNELKSGELNENENVSGVLYFKVPSGEEPEYLIYTTYNKKNSQQFSKKIYLIKDSGD